MYVGLRLWLSDNTTRELTDLAAWSNLSIPAKEGIVYLAAYLPGTYPQWVNDGYDKHGQPINLRQEIYNYLDHVELGDLFWYDPTTQTVGCGKQADIPATVPNGFVKSGKLVLEAAWRTLYDTAYQSKKAPGLP
jgi:hypothetical protein